MGRPSNRDERRRQIISGLEKLVNALLSTGAPIR
jgi:hypothetical protein